MKNIITILTIFIISFISKYHCQDFTLTPENFKNKDDINKDYIIINFPNSTKEELFKKTKKFINSFYNNPKYITSEVENEQLVIDALGSKFKALYQLSGPNIWRMSYKYEINFKDNKLMFKPFFKKLENDNNNEKINLVGPGSGAFATGIFTRKGRINNIEANKVIEEEVSSFVSSLRENILKENIDW